MGQADPFFFGNRGRGGALLRALVVDASAEERRYVTTVLNACGFDCVRAGDGIEALKYASSHGIDLIVTASDLPLLNGAELLSLARRGAFGKNPPPAIVFSAPVDKANGSAESILGTGDSGMSVTTISKPVTADQLIAAIAASFQEP